MRRTEDDNDKDRDRDRIRDRNGGVVDDADEVRSFFCFGSDTSSAGSQSSRLVDRRRSGWD